ncbi:MAG: response regulator [Candidatus Omnitrophica bacterium]|nr:response regulator [Candidatus Omnitrophota bacterium]
MQNQLLAGKHILIVEDDEPCRLLLEAMLEDLGCTFDIALNGQEGIDKMMKHEFDVVVTDIRMPVMTGYEMVKLIRKTHPNLPIVALTAHAMEWVKGKCIHHGMNDYLSKPFKQEKLVEMLLKWV